MGNSEELGMVEDKPPKVEGPLLSLLKRRDGEPPLCCKPGPYGNEEEVVPSLLDRLPVEELIPFILRSEPLRSF